MYTVSVDVSIERGMTQHMISSLFWTLLQFLKKPTHFEFNAIFTKYIFFVGEGDPYEK